MPQDYYAAFRYFIVNYLYLYMDNTNKQLHHIYSTVLRLFHPLIMETTNHINKT